MTTKREKKYGTVDAVREALGECGVVFVAGAFKTMNPITGRYVKPDETKIEKVFKNSSVGIMEYREECSRREAEEARRKAEEENRKKAEEEAKRKSEEEAKRKAEEEMNSDLPAGITGKFFKTQFIHPKLDTMTRWSDTDIKVFGRFRFVLNPIDGTALILISGGDGTWQIVPMGSNRQAVVGDLSSKCSSLPATDPRYANLYEEIMTGFKDRLAKAVDSWSADDANEDSFALGLGMHLPHSMLKRLAVIVTAEKVTCERRTPEGVKNVKVNVPRSATLATQKGEEVTPIDFMVRWTGDLMAHKELIMDMPKIISNDPSEPALCYIDLETICEEGPCPTWEKYLARFTTDEGSVIEAFIWGILDAGNGGRQMLYFYDPDGFSAKSAMLNCIIECLGEHMCIAIQKDSLNNQFSLAKVWDKRLVTYADNKNTKLLMSEKMHMITGRDYADIEMKGKNSFHAKLQCKVIASGNVVLEIHPDALHEVTRAIIVKPRMTDELYREFCALNDDGSVKRRPDGKPVILGDPTFEQNLKKEFRRFLTRCRASYEKLCPTRSDIQLPPSMYDELLSYAPAETYTIADFFDEYFEFAPGAMIPVKDFRTKFNYLRDEYAETGRERLFEYDDFVEYVRKKYNDVTFGVTRKYIGKSTRVVVGLKFRENAV